MRGRERGIQRDVEMGEGEEDVGGRRKGMERKRDKEGQRKEKGEGKGRCRGRGRGSATHVVRPSVELLPPTMFHYSYGAVA